MTPSLSALRIAIFADGADRAAMLEAARHPLIRGLTTNPSLMRKAGVTDYAAFGREMAALIPHLPISFEVIADDLPGMARQARIIASWGPQVFVKLPVTTTAGESILPIIPELVAEGVRLNITALFTPEQVAPISAALGDRVSAFLSVFAGRIADTGRDPLPILREVLAIMAPRPNQRLIWASPREVLNLFQADAIGCHAITMTHDLLAKLPLIGRDLLAFSRETVQMFHRDAQAAGFTL
ncbi:MAG: transaldolase [Rhodovarius sp.]|nr:transaldolase [Rhodovarius sp.]